MDIVWTLNVQLARTALGECLLLRAIISRKNCGEVDDGEAAEELDQQVIVGSEPPFGQVGTGVEDRLQAEANGHDSQKAFTLFNLVPRGMMVANRHSRNSVR